MAGKSGVRLGAGFVLGIGLALGVLGACEKRPTENDSVTPHPQHEMQALSSSDVVELRQATSRFHRLAVANAEVAEFDSTGCKFSKACASYSRRA